MRRNPEGQAYVGLEQVWKRAHGRFERFRV